MDMNKLSWKFVFNPQNKGNLGYWEQAFAQADNCGYPYIAWNGRVYRVKEAIQIGISNTKAVSFGTVEDVMAREIFDELTEAETLKAEQEYVSIVLAHGKIRAIKIYRERTGMGLKDSKDYIDALCDRKHIVYSEQCGQHVFANV